MVTTCNLHRGLPRLSHDDGQEIDETLCSMKVKEDQVAASDLRQQEGWQAARGPGGSRLSFPTPRANARDGGDGVPGWSCALSRYGGRLLRE
eukprot:3669811-Amphidinium_carterae.1